MTAWDFSRARWRKSSFSDGNSNCVEVALLDASWRKSSFSDQNSNCVEVAHGVDRIGIRDSKNSAGPALVLPPAAWRALISRTPV